LENQQKASIYAGLSVIFWATAASAFKIALEYLDFIQLLFVSTITSLLVFTIILFVQGKIPLLKNQTKVDIQLSGLLGLLNPFLYYLVLLKAYSLLPAQIAQPLNFTWPIVLVLLSIPLLKQKIPLRSILAIFISFAGVFFISSQGKPFAFDFANPFGVTLAVGSSLIWALFWIFNVRDKRDEVVKLFMNFVFAAVFITIVTALFSSFRITSWQGWLAGIYVGIFEMGITFIFWLKALKLSSSTSKIGNLIYLTPFFSLLIIHFIVGESIYLTTILGLILIVAGIFYEKTRK
jgi:drug/metabolite transporter (DMT)-like permease